jgi:amidohydrolase
LTVNEQTLRSLYEDMVKWRRHLHENPELSFQEFETARMIADLLESWGLEVRPIAGTGIVARLTGHLPGRTIALRADIDALAIQDAKSSAYRSKVQGVMHACGHDGHTAQLLAVARYYSLHLSETAGTRVFLFQPGEEVLPGGAIRMIEEGALEGVDAIYGVHLWSPMPYGTASTRPGPFMATPDEFEIEITGRGGHGGLPHQSKDALVTGASLVMALQTIVSRSVNPLDAVVISVGKLASGSANNVIAENCRISGTVRSFNKQIQTVVRSRLEDIVRHTCEMYGCEYQLRYFEGYPPVVNDETEAGRVLRIIADLLPETASGPCDQIMAGEDFSYYLEQKPGCFFFVGAGSRDGTSAPHHHPKFDIEEGAMLQAARLLIAVSNDSASELK